MPCQACKARDEAIDNDPTALAAEQAAIAEVWRVIREGRPSRPHKNEPRPRTDAETIAQARARADQEAAS